MVSLSKEIRPLLVARRQTLAAIMDSAPNKHGFVELRTEVDSALKRIDENSYGVCEVCGGGIEKSELLVNPLLRKCIRHLPQNEQTNIHSGQLLAALIRYRSKSLFFGEGEKAAEPEPESGGPHVRSLLSKLNVEQWSAEDLKELDLDINRARTIQSGLLPDAHLRHEVWETFYEYLPAGPLGGDYCDLIRTNSEFFLFLGDAMGKGIAACIIASRLHLLFRTLSYMHLPFAEMIDRANRIFCECVLATGTYATLVCARATGSGAMEVINAGHLPPLLLRAKGAERIMATGLPLGLFFDSTYEVARVQLEPGETLLFYTDGITEARDMSENEYGHERLVKVAVERKNLPTEELVRAC
jgi:hypothetical protein